MVPSPPQLLIKGGYYSRGGGTRGCSMLSDMLSGVLGGHVVWHVDGMLRYTLACMWGGGGVWGHVGGEFGDAALKSMTEPDRNFGCKMASVGWFY